MEPSKQNLMKFTFYHYSQQIYDFLPKEVENLNFVQGVNFEFIDSSKNKGPRHLLVFENADQKIRKSNKFVVIALAGSYRGLKTLYFKNKLFHWSKLCRDFELQKTHILLSESPRDEVQFRRLSARLRLRSELVYWYRNAALVPYGPFLIDLSPRTDDLLPYCTTLDPVPQNFTSRTGWNI